LAFFAAGWVNINDYHVFRDLVVYVVRVVDLGLILGEILKDTRVFFGFFGAKFLTESSHIYFKHCLLKVSYLIFEIETALKALIVGVSLSGFIYTLSI